jgi:hypothetical protein
MKGEIREGYIGFVNVVVMWVVLYGVGLLCWACRPGR